MLTLVLGGAATSIGASLILFACQIQFFYKFGWFMFLTCFFSILWSLFFFVVCLSFCGPAGDAGQVLWRKKKHPASGSSSSFEGYRNDGDVPVKPNPAGQGEAVELTTPPAAGDEDVPEADKA